MDDGFAFLKFLTSRHGLGVEKGGWPRQTGSARAS